MSEQRESAASHAMRRGVHGLVATALLGAVAACSPGGNVDIGSGQDRDPVAADFPMAYIKRTAPAPMQLDSLTELRDVQPAAAIGVYVRDRADPSAPERNVTQRVTGTGLFDIRDIDASFDGRSIVFAMRGPLDMNQDEEDPPTWNI